MIKHVVMFRLRDEAEGHSKEENLITLKEKLEKLPDLINTIVGYEVGITYNHSDRASDIVIISSFKSKEDLRYYSAHEEHKKVLEYILKVQSEVRVVDYEY